MIYFARIGDDGPVKVGYSADVPRRMEQLQALYNRPMVLLGTEPGGRAEEAAWHAKLAPWRFGRTEQFRPVAEVMQAIGRPLMVGANPEVVEAIRPPKLDFLMRLDSELMERVKAVADESGLAVATWVRSTIIRELKHIEREEAE